MHDPFYVLNSSNIWQKLYVSRLYELMDIEGLELAVCSVLDILFSMLSDMSKVCFLRFRFFKYSPFKLGRISTIAVLKYMHLV